MDSLGMFGSFGTLIMGCLFLFFLFCIIFMPVFIWQIRNQAQITNKLLRELIDATTGKEKTRYDKTGLIGDQGVKRKENHDNQIHY